MYKIKIDVERQIAKIDRKIYGNFIEHLGRCIYGGIYEEGSALSDKEAFRKDVLQAAQDLKVSILRWPGGNFSSGYHWQDGIGPKDSRPRKFDLAWFAEESNRFGTDEFVAYCRKLGAEPYICINLGNGTLDEAAGWVEYCNATSNTYYANLRRKYGHPESYRVKYWGLGNEIYGSWQSGHKNADDYAKEALEFGKAMKWVDPEIKLVACGANEPEWDQAILEKLALLIDYISIHFYVGSEDYYETLASTEMVEKRIKLLASAIEIIKSKFKIEREIGIAVDEWNVWYRVGHVRGQIRQLEEVYNLRDALCVASFLNLFQRNSNWVTMANLAQMVNVIAPILTSPDGFFQQTIYFPLQLYICHSGNITLDVWWDSDSFSSEKYSLKSVPYLDCAASLNEKEKTVVLSVVNRHREEDREFQIELTGLNPEKVALVHEINGKNPEVVNSFQEPENVKIVEKKFNKVSSQFNYIFPAHSITMIKMKLI